jgi:hypothetical protein
MDGLTTKRACEFLVRETETSGAESFEKNFIKNDRIICSVFVFLGNNAEEITAMIREHLHHYGFHREPPQTPEGLK